MDMEGPTPFPRASLFLASRLASVVQKFRYRLQEKVQQKKRCPNPFGVSYHRGIRLRALSDLERSAPPCRLSVTEEPRSAVEHQEHGKWINGLLYDLNNHSDSPTFSLTKIAADDKLLLSHSSHNVIETLAQHATVPQAAYMFDSSTFLIGRLEALQLDKAKKWADVDADCKWLKEEAYIANLLHLLRRLQQILFQVLVHRSLTRLDEFALHWQTYWQQQKKLGEGWFTEWPSGERPLSTTWPWNIRPSLVILWGVCWMFYTPDQTHEDKPRSPAQQLVDGSVNWRPSMEELEHAQRVSFAIDTSSMPQTTSTLQPPSQLSPNMIQAAMRRNLNVTSTSSRPISAATQPHHANAYQPQRRQLNRGISHGPVHEPQQGVDSTALLPTTPYTTTLPASFFSEPLKSRDYLKWTTSTSGEISTSYASIEQVPSSSNVWTGYNQQASPIYPPQTPVPTFQVSPVEGQNYVAAFDPITNHDFYPPYPQQLSANDQDMGGFEDYPSPHSERGRQTSIATSTSMPESVVADHVTTPSSAGSKALQISIKRGEPPRNHLNEIYCSHPECARNVVIFRRPCEWNKHMDKHDRPYKCTEPGCDKVRGFTYSGGLLRHQREVHKKNRASGSEFYCHIPYCNRNKNPFTRQENLREHVRRTHVPGRVTLSPTTQSAIATPASAAKTLQDLPRKRKRITSIDFDNEPHFGKEGSDDNDDSELVKRLRATIVKKDNRIKELEAELAEVRAQLSRANPATRS